LPLSKRVPAFLQRWQNRLAEARRMLHVLFAVALNGATVAVSDSRCNDIHINSIQGRLQQFAARPAPPAQQTQRAIDIGQARSDAEQEGVILRGVCSDSEFAPFASRLEVLDAWADLLTYANGSPGMSAQCPDDDRKVMAATAASAWRKLEVASEDGPPPPLAAKLATQIQALAAKAALALPPPADATSYWVNAYTDAGKQAIADCAAHVPHAP